VDLVEAVTEAKQAPEALALMKLEVVVVAGRTQLMVELVDQASLLFAI
jgi:hypothetical protein